jgi:hypothetical protein
VLLLAVVVSSCSQNRMTEKSILPSDGTFYTLEQRPASCLQFNHNIRYDYGRSGCFSLTFEVTLAVPDDA